MAATEDAQAPHGGVTAHDGVERRLSLLTAAIYSLGGVQVAFFPLWLAARGLDGGEIATILAACPAIRIVSNLIGARLGDRRGDHGRLLLLYAGAAALIFVALGFARGFPALLVGVTALSFAQAPVAVLNDGIILGEARRRRDAGLPALHFSWVRGWGSASVLLFMLGSGPVAWALPADALIWIMTAIGAFAVVASFFLLRGFHVSGAVERATTPVADAPLKRAGLIAAIVAAAALVQSSHGFLTVFASLHWAQKGYDANFVSFAWAIAIAAEVFFFLAASRWFGGERRAVAFLIVGGVGAALRWALMASDPDASGIVVAQLMHPFSASAIALGSAYLVAELGGKAYTARVHGWLAAANGAALSVALYISGPLDAAVGQRGYLAMSALAGAGLLMALVVAVAARRQPVMAPDGA